jgi:hypothetical protein
MSYKASLSNKKHSSAFSTSWWKDNTALYGSTTVSETFGEGMTEKVSMMRSGYSSRTLEMRRVPQVQVNGSLEYHFGVDMCRKRARRLEKEYT